ncbi:DUF4174 domain-containing protein [Tianweitania sp. BSSL-BM11]|uniref:DUF4174 domain-containing protein n=1 Tax=Tianweitania aestuarii TaxID=2814886 RepID=A0ABS5S1Z7_9HYPH|nr:DUF4174 domain-containing protein [Tianweitania aestuarii]MBS9721932.1 DUF4174 domain-containing protein [Tianweitania aestuarii]
MMMHLLTAASIALAAAAIPAAAGSGDIFSKFLWKRRVVLVFGDQMNQDVANQTDDLQAVREEVENRDLTILTIVGGTVSDGGQLGGLPPADALRRRFKVDDQQRFTVILLGKDGQEKLRDSKPVSPDALFALIDSMPMRQREAREND